MSHHPLFWSSMIKCWDSTWFWINLLRECLTSSELPSGLQLLFILYGPWICAAQLMISVTDMVHGVLMMSLGGYLCKHSPPEKPSISTTSDLCNTNTSGKHTTTNGLISLFHFTRLTDFLCCHSVLCLQRISWTCWCFRLSSLELGLHCLYFEQHLFQSLHWSRLLPDAVSMMTTAQSLCGRRADRCKPASVSDRPCVLTRLFDPEYVAPLTTRGNQINVRK